MLACVSFGCSAYWTDRANDAADVFTLTAEDGSGAKAQVGPLSFGLFASTNSTGLRGGVWGEQTPTGASDFSSRRDVTVGLFGLDAFESAHEIARLRGKDRSAENYLENLLVFWEARGPGGPAWPYYTQIEASVGVVRGVRVGFNPGELLDLFVGFLGLDLYGDDVGDRVLVNPNDEPVIDSPGDSEPSSHSPRAG